MGLCLEKIGVDLDELTGAQAEYLGTLKEEPFKPEMYRYLELRLTKRSHANAGLFSYV